MDSLFNLRSVDLNLLVFFDALMTELHVTRAANRIAISQSAMSNALARLRRAVWWPHVRAPARSAARIGVAIAGAGAIPLLVSLLVPPVVGVQGAAALALKNLARNGTLRAPAL